jgi:hypothetical protein
MNQGEILDISKSNREQQQQQQQNLAQTIQCCLEIQPLKRKVSEE